jgi:hypothetical protein
MTLSDMSDGLIPVLERSNWTSFMIHMAYEMDIDYVKYLYQMLIGYKCKFHITCKHMILITLNMAKIWLKEIKASCCRLKSLYHLKPWHV